ncbi:MAG: hypothetical protein KTR17_05465 [Cellvibrionaceae bacterium]|nr:hypothetical protein [Cellvibrionaceae bacterium]
MPLKTMYSLPSIRLPLFAHPLIADKNRVARKIDIASPNSDPFDVGAIESNAELNFYWELQLVWLVN